MRTKLVVLSLVLPLGGMLMQSAANAEPYKGTWEQQMACTPDVWRLCGSAIPDIDRIVACLRQHGSAAAAAAARRRGACARHARRAATAYADRPAAAAGCRGLETG